MRRYLLASALLASTLAAPGAAWAHCDAIGGPVTTAAVQALDANNVNLVLPYAPASAEAEMKEAFNQAATVRGQSPAAKALADRYFMETAVRLHRAGENAPYTGLTPAGTDFGSVIPAAEKALETGQIEPLLDLLSREIEHGTTERFQHVAGLLKGSKPPETAADVPASRERVSEELAFIGYVEGIYQATKGSGHAEGAAAPEGCGH